MELLQKHGRKLTAEKVSDRPDVWLEFDEGEFTDAEEMRQLSDANLKELRVKSAETRLRDSRHM